MFSRIGTSAQAQLMYSEDGRFCSDFVQMLGDVAQVAVQKDGVCISQRKTMIALTLPEG